MESEVVASCGNWRITKSREMIALEGPRGRYVDSVEAVDHFTRQHISGIVGKCLMVGLGLGISARVALDEASKLTTLTVLEQSGDVIHLYPSSPYIVERDNFSIVEGDFWTFKPSEKYDSIFIDIFGESNIDGSFITDDRNSAEQLKHDGVSKVIDRARIYTDGPVILWPYGIVAAAGWR